VPRRRDDEPEQREAAGADASAEVLEALRALCEQVGELRAEVASLRLAQAPLPRTTEEATGWEQQPLPASAGPMWARSLESPLPRRPAIPRLALEIAFLVAVAAAAALARLAPLVIVGVVGSAWALVAAIEWLAWRSAKREQELLARLTVAGPPVESDLSWFAPPLEQTAELEEPPPRTAKLPPPQPE
jgi:hypothetical protein